MLREIAGHAIASGFCFLVVMGATLGIDDSIRALWRDDPTLALALGFGALATFIPLAICVTVGSLKRGEQRMPLFALDRDIP